MAICRTLLYAVRDTQGCPSNTRYTRFAWFVSWSSPHYGLLTDVQLGTAKAQSFRRHGFHFRNQ